MVSQVRSFYFPIIPHHRFSLFVNAVEKNMWSDRPPSHDPWGHCAEDALGAALEEDVEGAVVSIGWAGKPWVDRLKGAVLQAVEQGRQIWRLSAANRLLELRVRAIEEAEAGSTPEEQQGALEVVPGGSHVELVSQFDPAEGFAGPQGKAPARVEELADLPHPIVVALVKRPLFRVPAEKNDPPRPLRRTAMASWSKSA